MWKRAWAWIAVCVSNVVATFVVYGITMNIWLSVLIGCCGGFCLLCGLLYCRTEKIHRTLTNLDKPSSLQPPQCCALHRAGFSQVFEKASQSLELTLELASTRYSFLGVSAKAVLAPKQANAPSRHGMRRRWILSLYSPWVHRSAA